MKRIAAITVATLAISLSATAAHADPGSDDDPPVTGCGGGYLVDALSPHLHYRPAQWDASADPDGATLAISAPRRWSFVRTAQGEGRFHDRSGNDLLSLRTTEEAGSTADLMAEQVEQLAGTPGLAVLGQHTRSVPSLGQRWSTLSYRYLGPMSEPRRVKVRWIAFGTEPSADALVVLTVAGRPLDGTGLDALLDHVTPTVTLAG